MVLALAFSGCGRAGSPVAPPKSPDPAPNPGNAVFVCGGWSPAEPTVELAAFDLLVNGEAALEGIRDAGGVVIHEYQVRLVRVTLPVRAVPDLFRSGQINHAIEVSLDHPFEFDGVVLFEAEPTDDDIEFLESLGVVVSRRYPSNPSIAGILPDDAVAAIRANPRVVGLDATATACIWADSGTDRNRSGPESGTVE